jgi:rRNA maturation protein Nop10
MTATENKFCSKCGAAVSQGVAFCPTCGNSLGSDTPSHREQQTNWKEYRFARRRGDRSGPLVGGLIVVWLGISLLLSTTKTALGTPSFWGLLFAGTGVILITAGALRWGVFHYRYPPTGYLIGGTFLLIVGLAGLIQTSLFLPAILIAIGLVIIVFGAYSLKGRTQSHGNPSSFQS